MLKKNIYNEQCLVPRFQRTTHVMVWGSSSLVLVIWDPSEAKYQSMAKIAEGVVVGYTLFKKSLLTPGEVLLLINNAWEKAQSRSQLIEMPDTVSRYVRQ